jgi:hypothetical protein
MKKFLNFQFCNTGFKSYVTARVKAREEIQKSEKFENDVKKCGKTTDDNIIIIVGLMQKISGLEIQLLLKDTAEVKCHPHTLRKMLPHIDTFQSFDTLTSTFGFALSKLLAQ